MEFHPSDLVALLTSFKRLAACISGDSDSAMGCALELAQVAVKAGVRSALTTASSRPCPTCGTRFTHVLAQDLEIKLPNVRR